MRKAFAPLIDGKTGEVKAMYEVVAFQHPITGRWFDSRDPADYSDGPARSRNTEQSRNPERDATIVEMAGSGVTHAEIGRQFDMTRQRVGQIVAASNGGPAPKCDICNRPAKRFDGWSVYCEAHWPIGEWQVEGA